MSAELKSLFVIKNNFQRRQAELDKEISLLSEERKTVVQRIYEIGKQIKSKLDNIVITEHAYLRFFERVMGFNLDDIKQQIISPQIESMIKQLGDGEYPAQCSEFYLVVRDNKIVTVKPQQGKNEGD